MIFFHETLGRRQPFAPAMDKGMMQKDILVVDDESLLTEMVSRCLAAHGYAGTTANSGEEACLCLKLLRFDLVLCDIHMAGMDGFDVLAACKALHPHTKVILCSGDMAEATVDRAFACGADSFVAKPFALDELLSRICGCLAGEQEQTRGSAAVPGLRGADLRPGKFFCV